MFQPGVVELIGTGEAVMEVEYSVVLFHILIQSQQQIPVEQSRIHTHEAHMNTHSTMACTHTRVSYRIF